MEDRIKDLEEKVKLLESSLQNALMEIEELKVKYGNIERCISKQELDIQILKN